MVKDHARMRNTSCFVIWRTMMLSAAILLFLQQLTVNHAAAAEGGNAGGAADLPELCKIIPKNNSCKGNFHIIYFDAAAGRCQEDWGCFETVFKSMEECRKVCEKDVSADGPPREALLLYLNHRSWGAFFPRVL